MHTLSAYTRTRTALHAFFIIVKKLFIRLLRFGIVTPCTAKRTAFQEYSSAYAGSVMHTKALDLGHFQLDLSAHSVRSPYPATLCSVSQILHSSQIREPKASNSFRGVPGLHEVQMHRQRQAA